MFMVIIIIWSNLEHHYFVALPDSHYQSFCPGKLLYDS